MRLAATAFALVCAGLRLEVRDEHEMNEPIYANLRLLSRRAQSSRLVESSCVERSNAGAIPRFHFPGIVRTTYHAAPTSAYKTDQTDCDAQPAQRPLRSLLHSFTLFLSCSLAFALFPHFGNLTSILTCKYTRIRETSNESA